MSLPQLYDEAALVKRLRSNDRQGFQELYERFAPQFLTVLLKIVPDQAQAEDLLHDSFLKIWLHLNQFDPHKGRLYTWMLTIVRNTALSSLQTPLLHCPIEEVAQQYLPVTHIAVETIDLASWVASTLSRKERCLIELVYFQGYSFQQVSEKIGYPLGSVKSCVRRALQQLRASL